MCENCRKEEKKYETFFNDHLKKQGTLKTYTRQFLQGMQRLTGSRRAVDEGKRGLVSSYFMLKKEGMPYDAVLKHISQGLTHAIIHPHHMPRGHQADLDHVSQAMGAMAAAEYVRAEKNGNLDQFKEEVSVQVDAGAVERFLDGESGNDDDTNNLGIDP